MEDNGIIIIGAGPAGVSASLYTLRAGMPTRIIDAAGSALTKAREVENYYGFPLPVPGSELLQRGLEQALRLGAELFKAEVVGLREEDNIIVETSSQAAETSNQAAKFSAGAVILAAGASHAKPGWQNFDEFEGLGISYCAVCDAFFCRGKDVAVAGNGLYALHEAEVLLPLAASVTLLTDGKQPEVEFPPGVRIIDKPVAGVAGDSGFGGIEFADGTTLVSDALFVALGTAGSTELARKIGAALSGGNIAIDANMHTNVPGLFAAGDCTGGIKQIAQAVYQGAVAGQESVKYMRRAKL